MKRAVIYARVSSLRQKEEGFSIPAQVDLLRRYAHDKEFQVLEEFVDVETAKEPGRKHFGRMMTLLRKTGDVAILAEKTDRLVRNLKDYVELEDAGVEIHFAKEGTILSRDARSSDLLAQDLKVMLARHYVRNLSEETRKGMSKKAEMGTFPSVAPLGYVNVGKKIAVDVFRRDVIRQCFLLRGEGAGIDEIADFAWRAGLRTKQGNRVHRSRIHKLLGDEFYYGVFRWKGRLYPGDHEPIITKAEWDRAQPRPRRHTVHAFAFRGLLTCATCGHAVTAERQKGHVYYHCSHIPRCRWPWVREDRLQGMLADVVLAVEIDDELAAILRQALYEAQTTKREELEKARFQCAKRRETLEAKLEQAFEGYLRGEASEATYGRLRTKLETEREAIVQEQARIDAANLDFVERGERIIELCKGLGPLYLSKPAAEQARLVRVMVSNLTLDGVTIVPTYEKPFDVLAHRRASANWLPECAGIRTILCFGAVSRPQARLHFGSFHGPFATKPSSPRRRVAQLAH